METGTIKHEVFTADLNECYLCLDQINHGEGLCESCVAEVNYQAKVVACPENPLGFSERELLEMECDEQLDELEFELEGIIDTLRKTLGLPEYCYVCGNHKVAPETLK